MPSLEVTELLQDVKLLRNIVKLIELLTLVVYLVPLYKPNNFI